MIFVMSGSFTLYVRGTQPPVTASGLVFGDFIKIVPIAFLAADFGGFFFPVAVAAMQGLKKETSKVHATNFGV